MRIARPGRIGRRAGMTTAADWRGRVGRNWAAMAARTDRSLAGLNDRLVAQVAAGGGTRLLDIGCGAGATARAVAAARPDLDVLGIDLSPELIAAARATDSRCRFAVADAGRWADPAFVPDRLVSRHGVMFFDDPVAAFARLRGAATPDARLVFSCFRDRAANLWATTTAAIAGAGPAANPQAPGPFAFADRDHVTRILREAGWGGIGFEPVDWAYVAGAGADPVADAVDFFGRIGPAASAIAAAAGAARERLLARLAELAERHRVGDTIQFGAAGWIVTANAA